MATFVQVAPDPFAKSFNERAKAAKGGDTSPNSHVRRPYRGIQIKEDTYATIEFRKADGTPIPLIDSGGTPQSQSNIGTSERYANFIVQSVSEQRQEKVQIVETFGEWFAFFYGERPRQISVSGLLINSEDFNWRAEFWENYDKYLRGTRCLINRARVVLSWDDIIVEGYIMGASAQDMAEAPYIVRFSFNMLLTNYVNVSAVGNTTFPYAKQLSLRPPPGLSEEESKNLIDAYKSRLGRNINENKDEYASYSSPWPQERVADFVPKPSPEDTAKKKLGVKGGRKLIDDASNGKFDIVRLVGQSAKGLLGEGGLVHNRSTSADRRTV